MAGTAAETAGWQAELLALRQAFPPRDRHTILPEVRAMAARAASFEGWVDVWRTWSRLLFREHSSNDGWATDPATLNAPFSAGQAMALVQAAPMALRTIGWAAMARAVADGADPRGAWPAALAEMDRPSEDRAPGLRTFLEAAAARDRAWLRERHAELAGSPSSRLAEAARGWSEVAYADDPMAGVLEALDRMERGESDETWELMGQLSKLVEIAPVPPGLAVRLGRQGARSNSYDGLAVTLHRHGGPGAVAAFMAGMQEESAGLPPHRRPQPHSVGALLNRLGHHREAVPWLEQAAAQEDGWAEEARRRYERGSRNAIEGLSHALLGAGRHDEAVQASLRRLRFLARDLDIVPPQEMKVQREAWRLGTLCDILATLGDAHAGAGRPAPAASAHRAAAACAQRLAAISERHPGLETRGGDAHALAARAARELVQAGRRDDAVQWLERFLAEADRRPLVSTSDVSARAATAAPALALAELSPSGPAREAAMRRMMEAIAFGAAEWWRRQGEPPVRLLLRARGLGLAGEAREALEALCAAAVRQGRWMREHASERWAGEDAAALPGLEDAAAGMPEQPASWSARVLALRARLNEFEGIAPLDGAVRALLAEGPALAWRLWAFRILHGRADELSSWNHDGSKWLESLAQGVPAQELVEAILRLRSETLYNDQIIGTGLARAAGAVGALPPEDAKDLADPSTARPRWG